MHGASQQDHDLYVMVNGLDYDVPFEIQEGVPGQWLRVIDTSQDSPHDIVDLLDADPVGGSGYEVRARSVVVLLRPRAKRET